MLEINGILSIEEDTFIGQGARLSVGRQGRLHFGNKFRNSGGMTIMAEESVTFGDNVLVSWGTNIMDTDYHSVIDINTGLVKKHFSPIYIGNKVWLGCSILKGTTIAEGCVIGAFAVVAKSFETPNSLIVGSPAIEKANNITRFID